jgi:hypothetical protein
MAAETHTALQHVIVQESQGSGAGFALEHDQVPSGQLT